MRKAGSSAPNGAPPIARMVAASAGAAASGVIAQARARSLIDNEAARTTNGAASAATRRSGPNACAVAANPLIATQALRPGGRSAGRRRTRAARTRAGWRPAPGRGRCIAAALGRPLQGRALARKRRREHPVEISARQQSARRHDNRPGPLAGGDRSLHQEPLRGEAAAWRQPHERQTAETKGEERHWHRASGASEAGDAVVAKGFGDEACGQEHRRLGERVRQSLHDSAGESVRGPGAVAKRKHEEQVADLRHGRIGDEQLQPLLTQREHAAEQDRS